MAALVGSLPKFRNLWTDPLRCFHLSTLFTQIRILKRPICTASDYNPLLSHEGLPRFNEFQTTHVAPAIEKLTHDFESDFTEFETKLQGQLLTRLLFKFLLHYFMNKSLFSLVEKGKPYLMLGRSWFGRSCVKLYSWIPWNFASRNVSTANSPQEILTDPMNKFYHVWNWKVFWKRIKESLWPTWSSRYEIFCELAISSLAQKLAL